MYAKLTRLRLTLAAALVVGGVAAPLAYATIGNTGKTGNAPAQKPTRIVTPVVQAGKTVTGAASAPTAVGDPYQVVFDLSNDRAGEQCHFGCSGVAAGHELASRRVGTPSVPAAPAAPNVVLYDQYDNGANNGIPSTNRTDSPSLTAQIADDFHVGPGQGWSITQVDVRGFPGIPCGGTVNVFFYLHASGLPGGQVAAQPNRPLGGTEADLSVTLSPAVVLNGPGSYFVSVQCNRTGSSWFWDMRNVQSNSPAAWKEAGGYATGCTSWGNRGTCTGTDQWPDHMFRLIGTSGPPTAVTLASFAARAGGSSVTVSWRTAAEAQVLGFNVWRYRGAKGVKVNRTLIRAKRSSEPKGASYRYIDPVRGARRGLTYRLQLVDLKGKRIWYAAFAIAT